MCTWTPPRFERSMMLQAVLTVPRAGYSEPYTLWWDATSGSSRIDHHGGSTSTYRIIQLDNYVQSVQLRTVRVERDEDSAGRKCAHVLRRCTVAPQRRVTRSLRALPVLPDLSDFTFLGYVPVAGASRAGAAERWYRAVDTTDGEERLTFRHEVLVARAPDNHTATPLRYAVAVDSSLVGENCDFYEHRFIRAHIHNYESAMFRLNTREACDEIEDTDRIETVESLREFTLLQRDPFYDELFAWYKKSFNRAYSGELEEAVRKIVLMQTHRRVSSGNRQGASFQLEVNMFADRVQAERLRWLGVGDDGGLERAEPFPHSAEELRALTHRLPSTFDWRKRGAVTHVRNQNVCKSCWAFAVTAAVEGALFVRTRRLVPLSEQALIDCSIPYRTNGCDPGSKPVYAYNYVRDHGLPPLNEYPDYAAQVLPCRDDSVPPVTRISGHVNITDNSITALKVAIRRNGPVLVQLDMVQSMFEYKEGIYHDARCKKNRFTHAMVAVGWDVSAEGETNFILKNSWGTDAWSNDGYITIRGPTNTCGFRNGASYPLVRASDVVRIPATATTTG